MRWKANNHTPICDLPQCSAVLDTFFSLVARKKNNIEISLSKAQTLYGITDTVRQCLGLNLCLIIAKYYIYTASKNEEDYFFDTFLSILKNKIQIETSKAKVQVKL